MALLELVCLDKVSIPKAAEIMGMKSSTAKYIMRCLKPKGIIMKKHEKKNMSDAEV